MREVLWKFKDLLNIYLLTYLLISQAMKNENEESLWIYQNIEISLMQLSKSNAIML